MSNNSFSFSREERLKSRKTIDKLFRSGQSFGQYPLRVVWMELETPMGSSPVQFALSVPKRKFKRASDRNRIRRVIREAYRLQKSHFYHHLPVQMEQLAMMVIYTGKEMPDYQTIESAMKQLLRRLSKKCKKSKS
ncbi:MAG: ribonuclease P protein component [Saprospiraceae bacterium]|nr:ribonuclease P protein component [Saprospiraceae bacterium]